MCSPRGLAPTPTRCLRSLAHPGTPGELGAWSTPPSSPGSPPIPSGTVVHNVELKVGRGGQIIRSAGSSARVLAREDRYTLLRLPSGEDRYVLSECMATIGQASAVDHKNVKLGKAGRRRNMGWRPTVRGVVMSPAAHPHGGGEGRSPIGMPGPKTPWGKPALGFRTRGRKPSDKFIVRRRGQR